MASGCRITTANYLPFRDDPLRSAESSRRLLLDRESELDPEPFSNLREECET
jgi:hypothetical protein